MPRAPKKRLTVLDEADLRDRLAQLHKAKQVREQARNAWFRALPPGSPMSQEMQREYERAKDAEIGRLFELKGALAFLLGVEET